MPVRDSAGPRKPRVAVVAEQICQGERKVVRVAGELVGREVEHLPLGAHDTRVGAQVS